MSDNDGLRLLKSQHSKKFAASLQDLSQDEQRLVIKKCNLWHDSQDHPSLQFRKWSGHAPARYKSLNPRYFRVSSSIRVFVIEDNSKQVLEFVGRHRDYEQFVGQS